MGWRAHRAVDPWWSHGAGWTAGRKALAQGATVVYQDLQVPVGALGGLSPGPALWKVGQRSFVVEHLVSRAERWVVDKEPREAHTNRASGRIQSD